MAVGGGVRTVALTITANVGSYVSSLGTAAAATTRFGVVHAAAMRTAGTALLGFGAVAVAGLGLAANEAIKWESAWAGVTKTVDGSTTQMQELEDELRSMAKTLPATHGEIAAVAEAAGQLGIARKDVSGFTKVMIDLGVSTTLTADQAATSIARMMNIMGTAPENVDRLGSALVALGNDGASTEGEILSMSMRIAGAGRSIGLTEGEVLGFANALSSLGIEAEAGGTAISTVMLKVQQATDTGGDSLTEFARVAGMSSADFKTFFERDAAGALAVFIEGLGNADAAGENTTGIMAEMGFEGIRVTDTLRRLAGNSDLLKHSLELGNSAWEENSALVEEANKRYATTASQIQIAQNNLRDTAITIGDQLLPMIAQAAEGFSDFAGFIGGLPAPLLTLLTSLLGIAGVLALVGGAFLFLTPQIAATIAAMKTLATACPQTAAALGLVGKALGIVAALFAVAAGFQAIEDATKDAVPGIEATTAALLDLTKGTDTAAIDELFSKIGTNVGQTTGSVDDLQSAFDRLANADWAQKTGDWVQSWAGIGDAAGDAEEVFDNIGASLAQMVQSGDAEGAAEAFAQMNEELGGTKETADQLMGLLPGYSDALLAADNAATEAAGSAEAMALGVAGVAQTSEEAEEAVDALSKALDAIFAQAFSVEEATDAFTTSLHDLTAAAKENKGATEGNTTAAIANRAAMRNSVDAALGVVDALAKQGASSDVLSAKSVVLRKQIYDTAIAAGFSKEEAERYASALDNIPATAASTIILNGADAALAKVAALNDRINSLPRQRIIYLDEIVRRGGNTGGGLADGGIVTFQANGSILRVASFANGSEHHIAQIAPAGAMRVWAEPETGGEAYIPLAQAKRSRSLAITQTVAERFGYQLVPKTQIVSFALGGVNSSSSSPSGVTAVQEHMHFHLDSAVAARQADVYIREANAADRRRASLRSRVR